MILHYVITVLWPKILNGAMFSLGSGIVAVLIIAPFRGAVKSGFKKVQRAIDSIDPETPTGITKQLEDVKQEVRRAAQ